MGQWEKCVFLGRQKQLNSISGGYIKDLCDLNHIQKTVSKQSLLGGSLSLSLPSHCSLQAPTFLLAPSGTNALLCQKILVVQSGKRGSSILLDPRVGLCEGFHGASGAIGEATVAQTTVQSSHPLVGEESRDALKGKAPNLSQCPSVLPGKHIRLR